MVETDEHGLVPSCSYPAEDGLTVRTNTLDAEETRSVNLDLVLSNHNLRCTTCNDNGRCELQETAIGEDVDHPRYGVFDERDEYEPIDDSSSFIQIDRNKCILCNRCVDGCNDVQVGGYSESRHSARTLGRTCCGRPMPEPAAELRTGTAETGVVCPAVGSWPPPLERIPCDKIGREGCHRVCRGDVDFAHAVPDS